MSLANAARSGLLWSTVDRFLQQGISFGISILLARLIAPAEFGLIAMVMVFVSISQTIMSAGMRDALIQRKDLTPEDCSSALTINFLLALLLSALLWAVAPGISEFYEEPRLVYLLRALCVGLLFQAPAIVQEALLTKAMDFKKITKVALPSRLLGGALGLSWAFCGFGAWSIVALTVSGTLLNTLFYWRVSAWRPTVVYRGDSARRLCPYGFRMGMAGLLESLFQNMYTLMIGKFYPPAEVAFYQRARGLQALPVLNFQAIIGRVLFPMLSSIQDDSERLVRGMRRVCRLVGFIIFPTMALLAAVAPDLIPFLIGDKWLPVVPLLQLLCITGALYPIHALNLTALTAQGHAKLFLRLDIIKKVIGVSVLIGTYRFGLTVMVLGQVVTGFVGLIINTYYTRKFINYGLIAQIVDLLPYALLAAVLGFAVHLFMQHIPGGHFNRLALGGVLYSLIYLGAAFGLRLSALSECWALLMKRRLGVG